MLFLIGSYFLGGAVSAGAVFLINKLMRKNFHLPKMITSGKETEVNVSKALEKLPRKERSMIQGFAETALERWKIFEEILNAHDVPQSEIEKLSKEVYTFIKRSVLDFDYDDYEGEVHRFGNFAKNESDRLMAMYPPEDAERSQIESSTEFTAITPEPEPEILYPLEEVEAVIFNKEQQAKIEELAHNYSVMDKKQNLDFVYKKEALQTALRSKKSRLNIQAHREISVLMECVKEKINDNEYKAKQEKLAQRDNNLVSASSTSLPSHPLLPKISQTKISSEIQKIKEESKEYEAKLLAQFRIDEKRIQAELVQKINELDNEYESELEKLGLDFEDNGILLNEKLQIEDAKLHREWKMNLLEKFGISGMMELNYFFELKKLSLEELESIRYKLTEEERKNKMMEELLLLEQTELTEKKAREEIFMSKVLDYKDPIGTDAEKSLNHRIYTEKARASVKNLPEYIEAGRVKIRELLCGRTATVADIRRAYEYLTYVYDSEFYGIITPVVNKVQSMNPDELKDLSDDIISMANVKSEGYFVLRNLVKAVKNKGTCQTCINNMQMHCESVVSKFDVSNPNIVMTDTIRELNKLLREDSHAVEVQLELHENWMNLSSV